MQQALYQKKAAPWQFATGSLLKIVAVVTMLIDHVGGGLLWYLYSYGHIPSFMTAEQFLQLYNISRAIGRTAFPIYCFLLIEGLRFTTSRPRYLFRLLLFALVSELPFDLALLANNQAANTFLIVDIYRTNLPRLMEYQNVFLTLAIGLIVIWATDETLTMTERNAAQMAASGRNKSMIVPAYVSAYLVSAMFAAAGWYVADFLRTDYDHKGVTLIFILYLLQRFHPLNLLVAYVYFAFFSGAYNEEWCFFAFLLLLCYNGKRGFIRSGKKYLFYAFYPVHLFLIYLLRAAIL